MELLISMARVFLRFSKKMHSREWTLIYLRKLLTGVFIKRIKKYQQDAALTADN